jgi:hypothetical protein
MTGVATAIAGTAVVGAVGSSIASGQQAKAARNAQNIAQQQQQANMSLQQPYNLGGQNALGQLQYLEGIGPRSAGEGQGGAGTGGGYGSLNAPFTTQMFQQMSPAYQFTRQQGGQGVLNQDASSAGSLSGAAMKDLMSFNSGLANQSFNNAFNQYQTQNTNTFNRLNSIAGLGQAAAAGVGAQNTQLAGTRANAAIDVGQAQAGGTMGIANALGQGALGATAWNANPYGGSLPSAASAASGGGNYSALNSNFFDASQITPTISNMYQAGKG